MATRVVRESREAVRRPFWILVVANVVTGIAFVGIVYAFDAMVH